MTHARAVRFHVLRSTYLSRSLVALDWKAVGMRCNSRLHATSALGPAMLIRAMARLDATLPCTLEPEQLNTEEEGRDKDWSRE